jgi:hypothetical protein
MFIYTYEFGSNYSKKKYYRTQSELQELQVLRQRVAELEEVLKQHSVPV